MHFKTAVDTRKTYKKNKTQHYQTILITIISNFTIKLFFICFYSLLSKILFYKNMDLYSSNIVFFNIFNFLR